MVDQQVLVDQIMELEVVVELQQQVVVLQDQVMVVPVELEYHLMVVIMPEVVVVVQVELVVEPVEPVVAVKAEKMDQVLLEQVELIPVVVLVGTLVDSTLLLQEEVELADLE